MKVLIDKKTNNIKYVEYEFVILEDRVELYKNNELKFIVSDLNSSNCKEISIRTEHKKPDKIHLYKYTHKKGFKMIESDEEDDNDE